FKMADINNDIQFELGSEHAEEPDQHNSNQTDRGDLVPKNSIKPNPFEEKDVRLADDEKVKIDIVDSVQKKTIMPMVDDYEPLHSYVASEQSSKTGSRTLREYAILKANQLVTDRPEEYTEDPGALALAGVEKVIKTDVEFAQVDQDERKTTTLSIGRFSFYRSKKKSTRLNSS